MVKKVPKFKKILLNKIENAPKSPGCYIYRDKAKSIIYVGKAKNIKNRVKSYFTNQNLLDLKTRALVANIYSVEFLEVDSEVEALILETNLIKKYHPKYNILMRDDKTYSWVKFEKQIKGKRDFPRIKIVRDTEKNDKNAIYFGPYLDTVPLKNILKNLRKVFPFVSCNRVLIEKSTNPLQIKTNNPVPCLYYHLGLCNAPCASLQSKKAYIENINNIKKFFMGFKNNIVVKLQKEMQKYSKAKNYEQAATIRDRINEIKYVTQNIKLDNSVDDVNIAQIKEEQRDNGLKELIEELMFPTEFLSYKKGLKFECYDISNIQGKFSVGSMAVMIDGIIRPDLYRKFRIKSKNTPDDFGMLKEVLSRRFSHLDRSADKSFSVLPNLIIIDGGKGQLSAAYKILRQLELGNKIPIVGLAKREEEIFKLNLQFTNETWEDLSKGMFKRIYLPRGSEALFLVQRLRDETHRFGITYHRKLRSKGMLS